jgi:hypothetical protein
MAEILRDDYVCACGFSINFKADFVFSFLIVKGKGQPIMGHKGPTGGVEV